MSANNEQIGGSHYKSNYQHWDLVLSTGMGYLEGCATKYLSRWRKKGGVEDLRKAQHYLKKLMDTVHVDRRKPVPLAQYIVGEVRRFGKANSLRHIEVEIIEAIAIWDNHWDLNSCYNAIEDLITDDRRRRAEREAEDSGAEPGPAYVDQG